MSAAVSGAQGYAEEAEHLVRRYESASFAEVHRSILHSIPKSVSRVLDIGAGTGRDAAAFAAMGHRVLAVEPTTELRTRAKALHPEESMEWLDDSLPDLRRALARHETFDVIMLSAVWMHLDEHERRSAMLKLAALLNERGVMIMSIRHGPIPPGRRMFEVTADETIRLARAEELDPVFQAETLSDRMGRQGVTWTRLAFARQVIP